jgi:hypothetical protein
MKIIRPAVFFALPALLALTLHPGREDVSVGTVIVAHQVGRR